MRKWSRRAGWPIAAAAVLTLALSGWQGAQAASASEYSTESAKASQRLLIDAAHAGARVVVVGDRGHILFSDDQGSTWTQARVPTRQLLTAVFFLDDKRGWAVGHDAQILATGDGGATWTKQFEDVSREAPLLDIAFLDAQHGLAVGAYGALLETTDGGQHWQDVAERLDNPDQLHLNAIAQVRDAGLFIVGEQGGMFRSEDNGQHWQKVEGPYQGSLFGVIGTAQARTLLAFGLRGNLLRSTDFGDTWQSIPLQAARGELEFGLAGATLLDDGTVVVVGNGGSVLRSTDAGQTFSVYNRPDRIALSGVSGLPNGALLLVGQGGAHIANAKGLDAAGSEAQP